MNCAQKIAFTNPTSTNGTGFTDTFYYYGDLTVSADEGVSAEYYLKRATARIQFISSDTKPTGIRKFYFYYTGGSGALDATTGYGSVNSKQAVIIDSPASEDGKTVSFSLYTFPHEDYDELSVTLNIINASDVTVYTHEFSHIIATPNTTSRYTGEFFKDVPNTNPDTPTPTPQPSRSTSIYVDTQWAAINDYSL